METLQHQIVSEWARFADVAEGIITDTQRAAVVAAHTEAHQLTLAALHDARVTTGADVVRLPVAALHDLIGVLGDGSPLRTLLDKLGQQAAQDVGDVLTHAVAVGRNPRRTARDIQDALGGNLNRALTIARTEQMRAYRTASLRSYQENSDILRGWQWRCSPSRRTCPVCLAMDGQEFSLEEPFASHQNCRCCPIPILRDRPAPPHETGAEWFAKQDEATQREMLGPGKQKLYAEGKLTLADLVGVKDDAQWGKSRYQRSIGDALAAAEARDRGTSEAFTESLGVAEGKKRGGTGGAGGITPPKPFVAPSKRSLRTIRAEEDRIRPQRFESAFAVDSVGTELVRKDGERSEVSFTRQEVSMMRGGKAVVLTHNHPGGLDYTPDDPRYHGNSFSKSDVKMACLAQLSELRVVTPTRRYFLRPSVTGWSEAMWNSEIKAFFVKSEKAVDVELMRKVKDGIITLAEKDALTDHEIMLRVSSKFGMAYGYSED